MQPRRLKCARANGERNALHLQNKTACKERGGTRGGLRETEGDEFNPKRQITRSTLRCLSLELALQSATHAERVCHPLSLRRTRTRTALECKKKKKTQTTAAAAIIKAHNRREVRAAAFVSVK